ncbi:MAG: GGDEF domain-containing protein, partial [Nitrosospira sp.]
MKKTDNNEASHAEVSVQCGLSDVPGKDIIPQKNAVIDDEAAVVSGTKAVKQQRKAVKRREKAADSREDAAYRREETATLREQVIYTAGTEQARDHAKMMQQANAQLVISAIEAHKLNERFEAAQTQLDHLAHHDILTGLPNRMLLADRLGHTIELSRRQGRQFALLFMDLDRFKHINDSLGHTIGDKLLKSVAQRIASCVRVSDTVSRQGGDEFVVLLSHIRQVEDAAISAGKILAALAAPHLIEGIELHASASIGISTFPDDGQDAEILL